MIFHDFRKKKYLTKLRKKYEKHHKISNFNIALYNMHVLTNEKF